MDPATKKRKSDDNGTAAATKKRKSDDNGTAAASILTRKDARKIIEPFTMEQLFEIVCDAMNSSEPGGGVLAAVRSIADRDPTQRRHAVRSMADRDPTQRMPAANHADDSSSLSYPSILRELNAVEDIIQPHQRAIISIRESMDLIPFVRDDDPSSENRANFCYRKYDPSWTTEPGFYHKKGPPKAHTLLAQLICKSYRINSGVELLRANNEAPDSSQELLWHHSDAIICCSVKASSGITFVNCAALDMLETTLDKKKDINLGDILGSNYTKVMDSAIMAEQGIAYLPAGGFLTDDGSGVRYDEAIVWKVFNNKGLPRCLAFMFINWSFCSSDHHQILSCA